ncbi:MAG TPA: ATP-binding protein, partial [Chitinophagaceae bacterium]|nr:ATP-binding protein [Chitinophagaceae bacterium]
MGHLDTIEILEQQAKDVLKMRSEAEANLKSIDLEQKKLEEEIIHLKRWSGLPLTAERNDVVDAAKAKEFLINAGVMVEVEGLFSNIPYDIVLFSTQHRYIFLNDAAVKDPILKEWMIGKTEEEYCLKTGKDAAEITVRNAHFQSVLHTKLLIEWEEQVSDNKGGWLYFLRRLQPLVDEQGQVKAVIGFGLNIFEKVKAGRQLPRSEKLYKDLFYHSLALICTHDMEGKILSVNPATCVLLQYAEKDLVGRFIYDFMPDKRKEEFLSVYLPAIQTQKLTKGVLSVFSKSGEKVYLLIQSFKVEEEGTNTFIIGFSQDITERITAEKKVLNAKKVTEQSAKAKETFLANLSHEIRTPMNGILGIAGLLSKTVLNEQQVNFLKIIQDSANNLLAIVNDVLDLEKIVLGKLQLEVIPFKLSDKVALTVQSFIYRAEEKGVSIITNYDVPANLVVSGDPFRLSQILNNFLSNALKFTEQGSITVTTAIRANENGSVQADFSIRDTGIGINKEIMAILFEPFVQAHASISRKYGGTGLGLGICKNLIEMQGGTLTVQSEEGAGSTFAFTVPYSLVPEQTNLPELPPAVDFSSLGKRKVLVAEDVELNQFIAKHIMESWGFEVVLASNGRQAINMIHQQ